MCDNSSATVRFAQAVVPEPRSRRTPPAIQLGRPRIADIDEIILVGGQSRMPLVQLLDCSRGPADLVDEVVVLDPTYDSYQATIALAGAVARPVPLLPPSLATPAMC